MKLTVPPSPPTPHTRKTRIKATEAGKAQSNPGAVGEGLSRKAIGEAVFRGIDAAFDKWRSKKQRGRQVNSLAYCSQAVTGEAERMAGHSRSILGRREGRVYRDGMMRLCAPHLKSMTT